MIFRWTECAFLEAETTAGFPMRMLKVPLGVQVRERNGSTKSQNCAETALTAAEFLSFDSWRSRTKIFGTNSLFL